MRSFFLNLFLFVLLVWAPQLKAQSSSPQYILGSDTLVVYKDVPTLSPSDKYTIRVRSVATNNQWVDVFAHYTYNRAAELGGVSVPRNDGTTLTTTVYNYAKHTSAWSHTYGNIEMSKNTPVEVEIAAKNGFKIANMDFFKATVHPAQKASLATMNNGKVYFTISNPGQLVIDINGQMDDYNAAINGGVGHPVHAISIFANPVIKKPSLNNSRVYYVEPGINPVTLRNVNPATFDTLYFKPGVHDLGQDIKIYPGKVVYLPGDALVYGNMNNKGVPTGGFSKNGENIRVYGYGTLSGAKITHEDYVPPSTISSKGFEIENGLNWRVSGISIVDPANHSVYTIGGANGLFSYTKVITWRANGDGIGGYEPVEDCFIRSQDDCSYAKGYKARCTFWKDANAALFHLATITENESAPLIIEDCDVIYARLRNPVSTNGGGFQQRGEGVTGQRNVNVIFRNFRIHDKLVNMPIIHLVSYSGGTATAPTDVGSSYKGILFQNISIAGMAPNNKQRILGCAAAPWYGGLIFDNLTIGGTLVTPQNHQTYFNTNEFVRDIWYRMPNYYTITNNTDATQGTFSVNITETTHIENSTVTLTAVPIPGYAFVSWSGDTTATTNPILLNMSGNKNITANFTFVGTRVLTVNQATNGTILANPAGTNHSYNSTVTLTAKPAVGYRFVGWSGDLTNTNVVTSLGMNSNKTLSAVFEKTNTFALNCGGDQYIAADGTLYAQTPDGFTQSVAISGTSDQFLYQSEKAAQNFSYALPVQNDDYTITLKFAEIYFNTANSRIFNVNIEGVAVLTNFDIYVEAGGNNKALDKTFKVKVTDGVLNLAFARIINNAKVSAIKIVNDPIVVVPVELTQFDVKKTAKTALLTWTTASEKNNAYFEIEQSTNGKAFQPIGRVKGRGTSQAVTNYDYEHISPATGVNYYRLQQVDIDGKTTASKAISVSFDKNGTTKIYPTLANGVLNVEMSSNMGATDMQILNLLGQVVDTQKVQNTEGVILVNISHLSNGSYIIRLISKNSSTVYRFEKH